MKNKDSKNKRKTILILLLVCIVVAMILIISLQQLIKKKEYEENLQDFLEFKEEYESQTILPRKIYELYNYEGEYDRDYLYKNMKSFVDYLDYLKTNVDENNTNKFYQKEKSNVLKTLGIDNQENFEVFVQNLANKNLKSNEFKYAEIETGTSYSKNGYFNFVLYLYYGENRELTKFNVSFAERKSSDIVVSYEVIK